MMAARGTRRPHVRRPRSRPVKFRKSGCAVLVLALAGGLSTIGWALAQVIA